MIGTKVISTLGPSSRDEKTIDALVKAGMDVVRINFSHGIYDEIRETIAVVRKVSSETGIPIAILGDLAGPKIRIGELEQESVMLSAGEELTITTRDIKEVPQDEWEQYTVGEIMGRDQYINRINTVTGRGREVYI